MRDGWRAGEEVVGGVFGFGLVVGVGAWEGLPSILLLQNLDALLLW